MKYLNLIYPKSRDLLTPRQRTKRGLLALLATSFLFSLLSCSTINRVTAGSATKQELLNEQVNKFNRAVYFGNLIEAAQFVDPDKTLEFMTRARNSQQNGKLVDLNVKDIDFQPETDSAEVVVNVRYFSNPTYIVKTREELQSWRFHRYVGGWLLDKSSIVKDNIPDGQQNSGSGTLPPDLSVESIH